MMGQRYYSPELCRFIQPDSIEYLDTSSINGLNLYCYCFNNPIMYYDPSDHSALLVLASVLYLGLMGAAASVTVQAVTDIVYGNEFDINNYLIAAGTGFIGGLCYAIPLPGWNSAITSAVTSGLTTAGQMIYSKEDYSVGDYIVNIGLSAAVGLLTLRAFGKATSKFSYFADTEKLFEMISRMCYDTNISMPTNFVNVAFQKLMVYGTVTGVISNLFSSIFKNIPENTRLFIDLLKNGIDFSDLVKIAYL